MYAKKSSIAGFSMFKGLRFLPDLIEMFDLPSFELIISEYWRFGAWMDFLMICRFPDFFTDCIEYADF